MALAHVLTFDDYGGDGEWPAIELDSSPSACRKFWAAMLQWGAADGAECVFLDLDRQEDCIGVIKKGEIHSLLPPPGEFRRHLIDDVASLLSNSSTEFRKDGGERFAGIVELNLDDCVYLWQAEICVHSVLFTFVNRQDIRSS